MPLVAIPSIKYFCPNRYSASVGISDTVAPAITTAQSVVYVPLKNCNAICRVYFSGDYKYKSGPR